jgi:hypothetical protein
MPAAIDHDALFKLVLTAFFREFIDLVAPDLAAALDPEPPVFLDKESFADLFDPDRREADMVVQMRVRHHLATLLIHLEHQAQADAALDRRMFRYFARLYDRYDQPIYPIALCSYPRPRRPAADRHELRVAQRTVLTFQYQVVQLNRMDWRTYLTTSNPAAMALMAPEDRWRVKAACLRLLAGAPLSGAQRRLIGQFVDIYLPLNARETQALAAEVAQLPGAAKEVVMELITSWERKGRAEGLREGRAEGLREGQRLVVERMLTRRFGTLSPGVRERLATLTADELTALADALLDFTSLAEVEAWLASVLARADITRVGWS